MDSFDFDFIISAAEELKCVEALKGEIAGQFREPSDEWIEFLTQRVCDGSFTAKIRKQFTSLATKASRQFLAERVNDRLTTGLGAGAGVIIPTRADTSSAVSSEPAAQVDLDRDTEIEITLEELEDYQILKAIAWGETNLSGSRTATQRATSP